MKGPGGAGPRDPAENLTAWARGIARHLGMSAPRPQGHLLTRPAPSAKGGRALGSVKEGAECVTTLFVSWALEVAPAHL